MIAWVRERKGGCGSRGTGARRTRGLFLWLQEKGGGGQPVKTHSGQRGHVTVTRPAVSRGAAPAFFSHRARREMERASVFFSFLAAF
jgi:hypothetical protein